jgi:hypothetical protein
MNERIRELAKEAGFKYESIKDIWFLEGLNPTCDDEFKKFAELIIDEVYSFLLDPSEDDEPWHSRAAVKKHFGVEE